jgi:hypothetical protein
MKHKNNKNTQLHCVEGLDSPSTRVDSCRRPKNTRDMAGLQPRALLFGLDGRAWEQRQSPFTEVGGGESGGRVGREWASSMMLVVDDV